MTGVAGALANGNDAPEPGQIDGILLTGWRLRVTANFWQKPDGLPVEDLIGSM